MRFRIPNDRKRYYLLAKWISKDGGIVHEPITEWPYQNEMESMAHYLETNVDMEEYQVPSEYITKRPTFR